MKKYVIDELQPEEQAKIEKYLDTHLKPSGVAGIYWLLLDDELLNLTQKEHIDCHPFYFAVELTDTALICEFLVRATQRLRCDCIAYADQRQREWALDHIEHLTHSLAILT